MNLFYHTRTNTAVASKSTAVNHLSAVLAIIGKSTRVSKVKHYKIGINFSAAGEKYLLEQTIRDSNTI